MEALFFLEIINIVIALVFLCLFLYRLKYLKHFAQTDRYLRTYYYPKTRIFFAILYVVLSVALLTFNIVEQEYSANGQQYLFAGGGGELINSVILVLQLSVLRQELKKERPYTGTHLVYFFYLGIISMVRFGLTLSNVIEGKEDQVVPFVLACCLMADSGAQLGYWIWKKQTMPEIIPNQKFSFDEFKNAKGSMIHSRQDIEQKICQKTMEDNFPYIKSTVKIESSKFRIILEILVSNTVLPSLEEETTRVTAKGALRNSLDDRLFRASNSADRSNSSSQIRETLLKKSVVQSFRNSHLEIISEHLFNLEQIKELYLVCGRFPLKHEIIFADESVMKIGQSLQLFLEELFEDRRNYQPFLLEFLHLDTQFVSLYRERNKNFQQLVVSEHYNLAGKVTPSDKNCSFMSIQIYRQLWIEDHYEFYIKVALRENKLIEYPIRRYSEFEDLDSRLKAILNHHFKEAGLTYELPNLPKKHLFHWDQEKIRHRRSQLETYLRKLCNDYILMDIPQASEVIFKFLNLYSDVLDVSPVYEKKFYHDVKVIKGNVSKALVNNEYVTFYEFRLFRQGIQIRSVNKRFSDFITLHEDLERWMNNVQICYKSIVLPQKHLYKSETHRYEKLRNYLQSVIEIPDCYKIYSVNSFFNINGNDELSDDTFYSAISMARSKSANRSNFKRSTQGLNNEILESPSMELEEHSNRILESSQGSNMSRISVLIDELGNNNNLGSDSVLLRFKPNILKTPILTLYIKFVNRQQ